MFQIFNLNRELKDIMENPSDLKILFVINPVSGGKKKVNWESIIRDYFKNLPHTIELYILKSKDDTGSLDYWIDELGITRIIAVGGDGTLNLLAKQLIGKDVIMGILPAGSANGMAKELDIPDDPKEALDIVVNGVIKHCDILKINEDDICLHLSDFGLNARLIKYFDESTLRGMWGYARMLIKALWRKRLMSAHIVADNLDLELNAYMVVIANASKYGTGVVINPGGNVDDGFFEIVIVRKLSFMQLIKMFFNYRRLNPKKVEIFRTKTATITTRKKTHFQVDGEYKGRIEKVYAEILPYKLKLLIKN
jgi:diacylglycerol kinase (ATP)